MDYIENLRHLASKLPNAQVFNARINFMMHIVDALEQRQLPKYRFFQFELNDSQIEKYLQENFVADRAQFQDLVEKLHELDDVLSEFRGYLQNRFGYWATITQQLMDEWVQQFPNQTYLELMAGNGYLSKGLRDHGLKSYCTDDLSWSKESPTGLDLVTQVESLDALSALEKYGQKVDAVVLAWSPDKNEIDVKILDWALNNQRDLIIIGEKYGATDSKKFWDEAPIAKDPRIDRLNQVYSQYDLVHDKIFIIH